MAVQNNTPFYRNNVWTLGDDFGLGRAGDQVARMALEVEPPFTLGVTGKWGSGKTSVMRRAFVTLGGKPIRQERTLAEPGEEEATAVWKDLHWNSRKPELGWPESYYLALDETLCIWFSPWQHQNETNPIVPLLREVQAQFTTWLKIKGTLSEINRRGGLAALALLEHAIDAVASVVAGKPVQMARGTSEAVRKGWREAEPDFSALTDGQRFHLIFEDAIKELLHAIKWTPDGLGKQARLVIFVDDLDRCEEAIIVTLLEAVKLYLGSRRCVFILGIDDGAVMEALKRHWKRSDEANREYLEKLFQANVAIPLPSPQGVVKRIRNQLDSHAIPSASRVRQQLARDIEALLEPNPRKIKNFINSLCSAWAVHQAGSWATGVEARRFVLFHYLRQYHRPVWRLLERQPETLRLLWRVLKKDAAAVTEGLGLTGINEADQRLLERFFTRAFSHVLPEIADIEKSEDPKLHRHQDMELAIQTFCDRQDRKRSDEHFVRLFNELEPRPRSLPQSYLYAAHASEVKS